MTEDTNQRINAINRGEVPHGYKKTKVGIVPMEWEETEFSSIFSENVEYTSDEINYPLYSLTIENGIIPKTDRYERSHLVKKEKDMYKIVRPNDFAYNPMNIRFGAVARHKGNFPVSVSGYYDVFTTKDVRDLLFMENFLLSYPMVKYYNKVSTGSLIEKQRVHFSQFIEFKLPLPKIEEREKIAEILTTCDNVLELKEKLIAEKQKQKKWLMQNLLTGKKRLKGFSEKWKNVLLGDICENSIEKNKNSRIVRTLTNSATRGIIEQEDFFDKQISNRDNISTYYVVKPNYFVYNPRISNDAPCGPINMNNLGFTGIVSPLYTVFHSESKIIELNFLKYYFKSNYWHKHMYEIANYGARSDRMNVTNNNFFMMSLSLPSRSEQNSIAEILSTADREIELLQQDLNQWKNKKKALMQLLLTGKVRLNI